MTTTFLAGAILVDSSAAIALADGKDQFHEAATNFFQTTGHVTWATVNETTHETYTRVRYALGFREALRIYDFLTGDRLLSMPFAPEDERAARDHLVRLQEHTLSFHDALCAAVMKRVGIYRIFTFDHHFWSFGFEVLPGPTRK
jgi:predicted nucleic acid-binding protein